MTGGPAATPMKRIALYIDVMTPLTCLSNVFVISASKEGKDIPMPVPQTKKMLNKYTGWFIKGIKNTETPLSIIPENVTHFITVSLSLISFPDTYEATDRASKGIPNHTPFQIPL